MALVELEDVASYWALGEGDAVSDASRDHADLVGADDEAAEFGLDVEDAVLRDDEEVAVAGVEGFILLHVFASCVDEVAYTRLCGGITIAGDEVKGMDPVYGLVEIEGVPS